MSLHQELTDTLHLMGDEAERITNLLSDKFHLTDDELAKVIRHADRIIASAEKYGKLNR